MAFLFWSWTVMSGPTSWPRATRNSPSWYLGLPSILAISLYTPESYHFHLVALNEVYASFHCRAHTEYIPEERYFSTTKLLSVCTKQIWAWKNRYLTFVSESDSSSFLQPWYGRTAWKQVKPNITHRSFLFSLRVFSRQDQTWHHCLHSGDFSGMSS